MKRIDQHAPEHAHKARKHHHAEPSVPAQILQQFGEVAHGVTDGKLSVGEADKVDNQLNRIDAHFADRADHGRTTPAQFQEFERQLDATGREIFHDLHPHEKPHVEKHPHKHDHHKPVHHERHHGGENAIGVPDRILDQFGRIAGGVATGELTNKQASGLEGQVQNIEQAFLKDRAHGKLTAKERHSLEVRLDKTSAEIFDDRQAAHVASLFEKGKLTAKQAGSLDVQIGRDARDVRNGHDDRFKFFDELAKDTGHKAKHHEHPGPSKVSAKAIENPDLGRMGMRAIFQ